MTTVIGLKDTRVDTSVNEDALSPANGLQTTVDDLATQSISSQPSLNYQAVVQPYLETLLGELSMNMCVASNLSFEQLGIDSLPAMTFVALLSGKLRIELSMPVKNTY